jgi:Ca-activated chloride channel homolog
MSVNLFCEFSDRHLDSSQSTSQRQLAIAVSVDANANNVGNTSLNLCLVLDHSGSMSGQPLDTVKKAARELIDQMNEKDYISVVGFDHKAKVVVANQTLTNPEAVKDNIQSLRASGGTSIDEGIKLALQELSKAKKNTISQAFVLTDGENEHGSNQRCLEFSQLAAEYGITLHTLGFGDHWNQDVLEKIADVGGGAMAYIESPDQATSEFQKLLRRVQSVGLVNAYLVLKLAPNVRLAELKPIAQVMPDTIELEPEKSVDANNQEIYTVRLGDLMLGNDRTIITNLYISHNTAQITPDTNAFPAITAYIRYDDPQSKLEGLLSTEVTAELTLTKDFQPQVNPQVQTSILTLAKYRQTQMAETKLKLGDRTGAVTMLQSAAKTALQMGDRQAATVLQANATTLQSGTDLSEAERKQTRMVSKTVLEIK